MEDYSRDYSRDYPPYWYGTAPHYYPLYHQYPPTPIPLHMGHAMVLSGLQNYHDSPGTPHHLWNFEFLNGSPLLPPQRNMSSLEFNIVPQEAPQSEPTSPGRFNRASFDSSLLSLAGCAKTIILRHLDPSIMMSDIFSHINLGPIASCIFHPETAELGYNSCVISFSSLHACYMLYDKLRQPETLAKLKLNLRLEDLSVQLENDGLVGSVPSRSDSPFAHHVLLSIRFKYLPGAAQSSLQHYLEQFGSLESLVVKHDGDDGGNSDAPTTGESPLGYQDADGTAKAGTALVEYTLFRSAAKAFECLDAQALTPDASVGFTVDRVEFAQDDDDAQNDQDSRDSTLVNESESSNSKQKSLPSSRIRVISSGAVSQKLQQQQQQSPLVGRRPPLRPPSALGMYQSYTVARPVPFSPVFHSPYSLASSLPSHLSFSPLQSNSLKPFQNSPRLNLVPVLTLVLAPVLALNLALAMDQLLRPCNRTVCLSNIHPATTVEEIANNIRSGGLLESIRILPDKKISFVTFVDARIAHEFVTDLQTNTDMIVHGQTLVVSWANIHSGPVSRKILRAVAAGASRNVYIGLKSAKSAGESAPRHRPKLPSGTDLRQDFALFGEMEQINFHQSKDCGFVNFLNISLAINLVELFEMERTYAVSILAVKMDGDAQKACDYYDRYSQFKISYAKDRCANLPKFTYRKGSSMAQQIYHPAFSSSCSASISNSGQHPLLSQQSLSNKSDGSVSSFAQDAVNDEAAMVFGIINSSKTSRSASVVSLTKDDNPGGSDFDGSGDDDDENISLEEGDHSRTSMSFAEAASRSLKRKNVRKLKTKVDPKLLQELPINNRLDLDNLDSTSCSRSRSKLSDSSESKANGRRVRPLSKDRHDNSELSIRTTLSFGSETDVGRIDALMVAPQRPRGKQKSVAVSRREQERTKGSVSGRHDLSKDHELGSQSLSSSPQGNMMRGIPCVSSVPTLTGW